MASNMIVLKGKGHYDEGHAGTGISPGEAIELQADGKFDPAVSSQQVMLQRGLQIALEDSLQGKTVTQAYVLDDVVFFYTPLVGDHIQVLVKSGEDIDVSDKLVVEGSGSGLFVEPGGGATTEFAIALTLGKVHDAMTTDLTGTANADDMGLITGTPGTDAPTLQGVDFGGTTSDEKGSFEYVLPPTYQAGTTFTLRVRAAMLTTISDGTATIDANVWEANEDGAVGSDLVTTSAQDMNSLSIADFDFVVTPTDLVAGDKIIIRLAFAGSDTGNAGVMIQEISKVSVIMNDASKSQVEALEDSGGSLGANTLMACRVIAS